MEIKVKRKCETQQSEDEMGIRKGPWTVEEDTILVNYIATHGEGRWNSVARCAGLKRTGKSCRLRWLNYLRPDVRRGNITLQEQILILELHSRWGNRWSKIAQHLPGRTDNEIKNYWRTRVMKQAKQLKCDVNSKQFRDTLRYVWMPRLLERIRAAASEYNPISQPTASTPHNHKHPYPTSPTDHWVNPNYSLGTDLQLPLNWELDHPHSSGLLGHQVSDTPDPRVLGFSSQTLYMEQGNTLGLGGGGEWLEGLWNDENIWFLRQQLFEDLENK